MTTQITKILQVSCAQTHWARTIEYNLERTLHYIELAAREGSRVVLFPEANLTSYYFPYVVELAPGKVEDALERRREAAAKNSIWVIAGSLNTTAERLITLDDVRHTSAA